MVMKLGNVENDIVILTGGINDNVEGANQDKNINNVRNIEDNGDSTEIDQSSNN